MVPYDMPKFQAMMASLAEVFAKQLSRELADLYWEALQGVAIEQFTAAGQHLIRFGKHFPKPVEILDAIRDSRPAPPPRRFELPEPDRKWLRGVNRLFLQYLEKRRLTESFQGDLHIARRRAECLRLVGFFEELEAEHDPEATPAEMGKRFAVAMARITLATESPQRDDDEGDEDEEAAA